MSLGWRRIIIQSRREKIAEKQDDEHEFKIYSTKTRLPHCLYLLLDTHSVLSCLFLLFHRVMSTNSISPTAKCNSRAKIQLSPCNLYPNVAGSGRQGCNPAGESPAMIIVRFGHVAIPQFWEVTPSSLRGVNVPAAREALFLRGGCNLGG